jgi:hypothetical protein
MGRRRSTYKILVGKSEGRRSFVRYNRRWKDNIRMDVREIGWEVMERIHLAQHSDQWRDLMNTVMNLRVP